MLTTIDSFHTTADLTIPSRPTRPSRQVHGGGLVSRSKRVAHDAIPAPTELASVERRIGHYAATPLPPIPLPVRPTADREGARGWGTALSSCQSLAPPTRGRWGQELQPPEHLDVHEPFRRPRPSSPPFPCPHSPATLPLRRGNRVRCPPNYPNYAELRRCPRNSPWYPLFRPGAARVLLVSQGRANSIAGRVLDWQKLG